ncbi:MAG TPA: phosphatase PAP2 family protein [Armatimonadetes bacterium]|nr:phosphatase PAP2 family protein [Armatimonadota bacterium]
MLAWDRALFELLNQTGQNRLFDVLMPFITDFDHWKIPLALVVVGLCGWGGKQGRRVVLLALLTVALSETLTSHILKPWVARLRPCHVLPQVHLLVGCSSSYSFPSSHAANSLGLATVFGYYYRRWAWLFVALALLVGYSRIYVGVHYPLDVLGGQVVGVLSAAGILAAGHALSRRGKGRLTEDTDDGK